MDTFWFQLVMGPVGTFLMGQKCPKGTDVKIKFGIESILGVYMENWMQKYENNKEKTYVDILQGKLEKLIDLVDNAKYYEESKMIEALSKIIGLYEKQKEGGFDFNEKDMIFRKKQLAEIRYRKLKREHIESKESESWNEFEKDEEQEELEDEER